jgi:hypothetical protein
MMLGPSKAPSSPPETPVPMKRRPFSSSSFVLCPADAVREVAVTTVDDDVTFFEEGQQGFNNAVDHGASFNHDHYPAGTLQAGTQFLDGMCADNGFAGTTAVNEFVDPAGRAIEYGHGETMAFHIEDEVFAHDGEADQADICF